MSLHRVGVVNAPVKVGPRGWTTCWRTLARNTAAFGVNESLTRRQRLVYAALTKARGWGAYGLWSSPNPIFYDKTVWTRVKGSGRIVKLHDEGPLARSYPGYNSARYATLVVLERRSGMREAIVCTHLVSAGHKVPDAWRNKVRESSKEQLRGIVDSLTGLGLVVWVIGDMNIPGPINLGRTFTWIEGQSIDKVGVGLPVGVTLGDHEAHVIDLPASVTDHKRALVGRAHITKEKP